jgi:hypothetical protein
MPLTSRVIQETLRSASILSFTFREAVQDVEFQGYIIPKGWKVLPVFRSIHHSADFYPQPEKFDPSRFEVPISDIYESTLVTVESSIKCPKIFLFMGLSVTVNKIHDQVDYFFPYPIVAEI